MDMPAVASTDKCTRGSDYGGYDDGCRTWMPEAITPTRKFKQGRGTSIDQTTTRNFVITKLRSNDDEEVCYYKASIKQGRGCSLLQFPKKCAEDLKLEIRD